MPADILHRLAKLYAEMEANYDTVARQVGLSCTDCPDNCCTSYFQHHTHVEWAYLWEGLAQLPDVQYQAIRSKAGKYVQEARHMLTRHTIPNLMCPLNCHGRCTLYAHRLMICRLHGVPNVFTLPNGQSKDFPGCFRCQEIVHDQSDHPILDRTMLYRHLADLEMEYVRMMPAKPARVRLTLAEMIHQGPPMRKAEN